MNQRNTSQDPEYEGPVFHEKRVHKTHFGSPGWRRRMYDFSRDPAYYQVRPGVWRKIQKEKYVKP